MTIGDFASPGAINPEWVTAVQARFRAVNAGGGLLDVFDQRHKVVLSVCDTEVDPDQTARCAQRAVDRRVAAVVGMAAAYSDRAWPILEAAGIPVIGPRVNGIGDATSPVSFPLAAGLPGQLAAMPEVLAQHGATRIAVILSDFGTGTDDALTFIQRGLSLTPASAGPVVRVPQGATNLAPAVAAATRGGVDGIVGLVAGGPPGSVVQQLRSSSFRGGYATLASFGNAGLASDPNPSIDGTFVVSEFALPSSGGPGFRQFHRDMATESAPRAANDGTINFWLSAWIFEGVARSLSSIDAGSVLRSLEQLNGYSTGGITPPLTTTRTQDPTLPRLFNSAVVLNTTQSGRLVSTRSQFFDVVVGRYVAP
jgi:ABC-type branched-subunit amino acid transport system substrate-binding protein